MYALSLLSSNDQAQALRLQYEIAALREAHACITEGAASSVIYGRVDDLINRRQDALVELVAQQRTAEAREANLRG